MRKLKSLSIECDGDQIRILDQTQLPQKSVWLEATDPETMIGHIRALRVRGAPLIGIAAALVLAVQARRGADEKAYRKMAQDLLNSRPTAVNLHNAMARMTDFRPGTMDLRRIVETAEAIFTEDVELCAGIARYGSELIQDGDGILTHCNTGGLATAGVGTAIGIIRAAHDQKKAVHIYVDETRPLLQGGRLTAWEMGELGIPYTLICDNMAALMMREKKVQKVLVGCDRIATNGDFANKVGTYNLAVLARYHNVPFYVAGPYTTIDINCESGAQIPIEERAPQEVRGVAGAFGQVEWAPVGSPVFNPAFDVTPAELVSGWILNDRVLNQEQVKRGGLIQCTQL